MTIKDCLQKNLDTPQALTQSFIGKVFASGEVKYMIPYDVSIKEKHFPLRPDDCDFTYTVYEKSVRHSIGQYCMDTYYPVGSTIQLGMYKCTITSYGTPQKNIFGNNMYYVDMSVTYVQDIEPNTCITDTETEKNAVACMNNVIATINTMKNIINGYSRDPYEALFENNTTNALKDAININMVEKAYITDLAEKSMAYSRNTHSQDDISEMDRIRNRLCNYLHNIVDLEVDDVVDSVSTVFYMYRILHAGESAIKPKMCVDYNIHFLPGINKYVYLEFSGKYDIIIELSETSIYDPDINDTAFDMSFAVINKNENTVSKWMYFKSISNLEDGKYWTDIINEFTASIFTDNIDDSNTFDEYIENLMSTAKERTDLYNNSLHGISVDTTTGLVITKNTLAGVEYRYNLTYGKDETVLYSDYIF